MRIRAKGKLLLLACIFFVFSVGFAGTEPVKILDEPIPLIDLNAAIKDAKYGQNGNESHQDGDDPSKASEQQYPGKEIKIRVRGEACWLGENRLFSLSPLRERIVKSYKTGDKVILEDDFAESHYYKEILAILEQLNEEKGIPFFEK
ncbi:MAG: hypothetical protein J5546_04710 [Lachnospiraceae bacterium]|jgi:hypothetical protein|nr:hypothetical protein [Lachnospiraceae bacterium]